MLDIVITRTDNDPKPPKELSELEGVRVFTNPFQPSVNEARLLALDTGDSPYLMWFDPDDPIRINLLINFINEFLNDPPELGLYSPMESIKVSGEVITEPCDVNKSLLPRSTHMTMIFNREFGINHRHYFEYYLWGDYLLRVKLLTMEGKGFRKSSVPPISSWKTHKPGWMGYTNQGNLTIHDCLLKAKSIVSESKT